MNAISAFSMMLSVPTLRRAISLLVLSLRSRPTLVLFMAAKTYKALAKGFAGGRHNPGDIFTYDGPQGSWMEEVKPDKPVKAEKPVKE